MYQRLIDLTDKISKFSVVHSSMNRLTGGQAKNERDIMIQLKSTVHGGGALDDMPNAVVMARMVTMMVIIK